LSERGSQRFRKQALPYPYRDDGLVFDVDAFSLDGGKPREVPVSRANRRWSVPDEEWESCRLYVTLELPGDVVDSVFPKPERDAPPGSLYVALRCRETIYRDRHPVEMETVESRTYEFSLHLEREQLRGEVELQPFLVRSTSGTDEEYATTPSARLASSRPWTVLVDGGDNAEGETGLEVRVESFSNTPQLPDDGLYDLDLGDPSDPLVVVNGDHRRIAGVLQSDGSVGAEARMRDVLFDQIQYGVWSQLILHAGVAVDSTGRPQHKWQRTVLRIFVRDLYGIEDTTEASLRLRNDLRDPTTVPEVMQRIDRLLQRYLQHREQVINLMEEGLQI
jgi:hypothetical protein